MLTSRVRVSIDYDAPLATSFAEMRKILQSVLPARLTPEFSNKIDVSTGGVGIGSDAIGIAHIIEMPTPFHCSSIARAAVTQAQFILKPNPAATLNASAHCPALSFSVFPLVIRPEPMPPDSWENWKVHLIRPIYPCRLACMSVLRRWQDWTTKMPCAPMLLGKWRLDRGDGDSAR